MIIVIPASPEKTTYQINKAYIDYISDSGYVPWLVTPQIKSENLANGDTGLLLPGGKDIDPIFYGDNNYGSYSTDPEKDAFERDLFHAFFKKGKPIFGICRGLQLIIREYIRAHEGAAVDLLYQQDIVGHSSASSLDLMRTIPSHYIKARTDLLYGSKKGKAKVEYMPVNSMHHQYLHVHKDEKELEKNARVNDNLFITGWTRRGFDVDDDGVVAEGVIIRNWGKSKIAAVQWHPEELKDYNLIKNHFGGV